MMSREARIRKSESIKEKLKNPEYKKQWCEKSKKGASLNINRHIFTKEEQIKGSNNNGRFKKDDERTKNMCRLGNKIQKEKNPNKFSNMGKVSRQYENETAKTIMADKIYLPQEICDRIILKDGKIVFIEIKHPNEELRPKQKEFQQLAKDQYQILYGE